MIQDELEFWVSKGFFVPWSEILVQKAEFCEPKERETVTYDPELFPAISKLVPAPMFHFLF